LTIKQCLLVAVLGGTLLFLLTFGYSVLVKESIESWLVYKHGPDWISSPVPVIMATFLVFAGHCLGVLLLAIVLMKTTKSEVLDP